MSGALSHDIMGGGVRAFRTSAIAIGLVMTGLGLVVLDISINVLVGWAFAIAASTFCPSCSWESGGDASPRSARWEG